MSTTQEQFGQLQEIAKRNNEATIQIVAGFEGLKKSVEELTKINRENAAVNLDGIIESLNNDINMMQSASSTIQTPPVFVPAEQTEFDAPKFDATAAAAGTTETPTTGAMATTDAPTSEPTTPENFSSADVDANAKTNVAG